MAETVLSAPFTQIGASIVTVGEALAFAAGLALLLFAALAIALLRAARFRREEAEEAAAVAREADARMAGILQAQAEIRAGWGRWPRSSRRASRTQSRDRRAAGRDDVPPRTIHRRADAVDPREPDAAAGAARRHRHGSDEHPVPGRPGRAVAGRSCRTSRRVAPSASRGWRRSSPTDCRRAPTNSRPRFRTAAGRTASFACRTAHRHSSSTPSSRSRPGT